MNDCVFCKIATGEIPKDITEYEDGSILSFADIKPVKPGHTLLIPKTHYHWFYELPDDVSDKLFRAAKKVAKQLKEETGADFIQLKIDGVHVPHVHIHLIPRPLGEAF